VSDAENPGVYPLSVPINGMRSVSLFVVLLALGCGCSTNRTVTPDATTATHACRSAAAARQAATKLDFTTVASDVHLAATLALELPLGSKYPNIHKAGVGVENDTDRAVVLNDLLAFLKACHEDGVSS
jgi:hypothetical protein